MRDNLNTTPLSPVTVPPLLSKNIVSSGAAWARQVQDTAESVSSEHNAFSDRWPCSVPRDQLPSLETSFDPPPATRTTREAARMLERRSLGAKCCEEAVSMNVESAVLVCVRIGMTMFAFSRSSSTWSRCEKSPSAPGLTVVAKTLAAAPSAFVPCGHALCKCPARPHLWHTSLLAPPSFFLRASLLTRGSCPSGRGLWSPSSFSPL